MYPFVHSILDISSHFRREYQCDPYNIQDSNNTRFSPRGFHACLLSSTSHSTTAMDMTPFQGDKTFTLNHLPSYFKYEKNLEAIHNLNASNTVFHYYSNSQSLIKHHGCISGLPDYVGLFPNLKHLDISNISSAGLDFNLDVLFKLQFFCF